MVPSGDGNRILDDMTMNKDKTITATLGNNKPRPAPSLGEVRIASTEKWKGWKVWDGDEWLHITSFCEAFMMSTELRDAAEEGK